MAIVDNFLHLHEVAEPLDWGYWGVGVLVIMLSYVRYHVDIGGCCTGNSSQLCQV